MWTLIYIYVMLLLIHTSFIVYQCWVISQQVWHQRWILPTLVVCGWYCAIRILNFFLPCCSHLILVFSIIMCLLCRKLLLPLLYGKINDMCFYLAAVKNWNALPNNITSWINYKNFVIDIHVFIVSKLTNRSTKIFYWTAILLFLLSFMCFYVLLIILKLQLSVIYTGSTVAEC